MTCNQRYPTNMKYKTNGILYNSVNDIIWALNILSSRKHQLQTSVRCIAARQRYVCFFLYEKAETDFIDYI